MTLKELVEKQDENVLKGIEYTGWRPRRGDILKISSQIRLEMAEYILADLEIRSGWTFNRISKIIAELEELKP